MWSHAEQREVEPEDVLDDEELADYHRARDERARRRASKRVIDDARRLVPNTADEYGDPPYC